MCEANVKAKYTGIPGVTRQVLVYDKNPGWCIKCIKELLSWYENEWKSIPTAPEVVEAYNLVFREMFLFIHTALKNNLWTD